MLEADDLFNGVERLLTTLLGIAFALGIIALLEYLVRRSSGRQPLGGELSSQRIEESVANTIR